MRKAACWIVRQRRWILALTLILAAVCGILIPGVQVNSDMTKYLPEDSQMRAGMRLMEAEFPEEEDPVPFAPCSEAFRPSSGRSALRN